jgi:hypothetical protein
MLSKAEYKKNKFYYFCENEHYIGCKKLEKYNDKLYRKRTFEQGTKVIDTPEKLSEVQFVWIWGKPVHVAVIISMQYRFVAEILRSGQLREAVRKAIPFASNQDNPAEKD